MPIKYLSKSLFLKTVFVLLGLAIALTLYPFAKNLNLADVQDTDSCSNILYFPTINSSRDWQTTVSITNTECKSKQRKANVTLIAYDKDGLSLGVVKNIARLRANKTKNFYAKSLPSGTKSLTVESKGNLIGNTIFKTKDGTKSEVVPAIKESSQQLYFPALASYDDLYIYETITLLNPNTAPASVDIIALDKDGYEIDHDTLSPLSSMESRDITLVDIFNGSTLKNLSTVRVISDSDITGLQLVDYPEVDLVGLPALATTSKAWTFPIVTKGENLELWTKVGILNTGNDIASITVEAFDISNNSLGVIDSQKLFPGTTYFLSTLNAKIEDGVIPLNTAFLKVTSDQPVSGYEVIGVVDGNGLTAILGIQEEDQTTVGFEITGSDDGDMLNVFFNVLMTSGNVKSIAPNIDKKGISIISPATSRINEITTFIPTVTATTNPSAQSLNFQKIGINTHWQRWAHDFSEFKQKVKPFKFIRDQAWWKSLEKFRESELTWEYKYKLDIECVGEVEYDSGYDNLVRKFQDSDAPELLLLLSVKNDNLKEPEVNAKDYYDYVFTIVERYDGDGIDDMPELQRPVLYFEVGNEVDYLSTGGVNHGFFKPMDYVKKRLIPAYKAAKAANPKAVVMGAGLGMESDLAGNDKQGFNTKYLEKMYKILKKVKKQEKSPDDPYFMDKVAIHYYSKITEPGEIPAYLKEVKKLIRKYEGWNKPIWVTEYGVDTNNRSEDEQKEILQQGLKNMLELVERVFVFELKDDSTEDGGLFGLYKVECVDKMQILTPKKALEIFQSLTVTSPNGGETLQTSTTYPIKWTYTGSPGSSVKIDLLKGDVVDGTITSSASIGSSGSGSYSWAIPSTQTAGSDYTVRVTSTSNSSYTDTSDSTFTISTLRITSISPSSATKGTTVTFTLTGTGFQRGFTAKLINELGEEYDVSSSEYISSTQVKVTVYLGSGHTSTQYIKITNPDGESAQISFTAIGDTATPTATPIATPSPTPTQTPTIPDLTSSAMVASSYTSGKTGVQIPVTVYRSGDNLTEGTYVHAKLYWSTDSTWDTGDSIKWSSNDSNPDFPNSVLNSTGSKTVTATIDIPSVSTGTYYIISYADAPTSSYPNGYHSESNEDNNTSVYNVSISKPSNESPKAGFTMKAQGKTSYENETLNLTVASGQTVSVSFSASRSSDSDGSIASYKWYINGTTVSTSRDFSYDLGSGTHQIYLEVWDNLDAQGSVGATIIITTSGITVASPNGGESWQAGTTQTIGWTYTGSFGDYVKIELLKGGTVNSTITSSTSIGSSGSGSYSWTISSSQTAGGDYKVRVTSTSNSSYTDTSDSNFTITAVTTNQSPTVGFTMTAQGKTAYENETLNLTVASGQTVSISFSALRSSDSDGSIASYKWSINGTEVSTSRDFRYDLGSGTHQIYLEVWDNLDAQGSVGATIIITTSGITVASPNGGESWQAGTTKTISWTYTGSPGSYVKIELLKGGSVNSTITSSTSIGSGGSGSYSWTISSSQTAGSDYTVKVTSTSNSSYTDTSDSNFTITTAPCLMSITSISPSSANKGTTVTFTLTGTCFQSGFTAKLINELNVEYDVSSTQFVSSTQVKVTVFLGCGPTSTQYIKITNPDGENAQISFTAYGDTGTITVTSPNGGESWQAGTTRTISWSYTGCPGDYVKIELLKGGSVNSTITTSTSIGSSGSGSYSWTISSSQTAGSDYKVRVTSTSNNSTDTSDSNFTISSETLRIDSISPSSATKGTSVTFTLTGTGFQSGFTAKLINELNVEYDVSSTQFVSSTQVKVTVFLGSGPTSTQYIKIINPDGQSAQISFTAYGNI